MFDGTLSFDRVLMPASQASTALRHPPSTTSWSPSRPAGKRVTGFSVVYRLPTNPVPLPPRAGGGKVLGTRSPSPRERGEARVWECGPLPPRAGGEARFEVETRSPSPDKQGEARFWVNRPSPPCFSCPPPLRGWVASGARRKGASVQWCPFLFRMHLLYSL